MPPSVLITGASGKVGTAVIARLLASPRFSEWRVVALCHTRRLDPGPRLEVRTGDMSDSAAVRRAVAGVTHVVHLATCKETADRFMDVSVKGFHHLVEECRASPSFRQLVLLGGDCAIGHFFWPRQGAGLVPEPEAAFPHAAYPGVYALSKVLEEVILQQVITSHAGGFNGCCLRCGWVMAADDFRSSLSWGNDAFGGPRLLDLVGREAASAHAAAGDVGVLCDAAGAPLRRTVVHVDDLADAVLGALDNERVRGETIHVAMDEPVDYSVVARVLTGQGGAGGRLARGSAVRVGTPYHSVWLDNAKARRLLRGPDGDEGGWRPRVDARRLVELAWAYVRAPGDPRVVYYPG